MATGSPALSHLLHADPSLPPLTRPPTTNPAAPTTSPNAAAAENSITYAASTVSPSGPSYGGSPSSNTSGTSPNAPGQAGASAPRSHASNASLYQCADCLRRYSRPEHLQRHIATHTLGKRFLCDVRIDQGTSPEELQRSRVLIPDNRYVGKRLDEPISSRDTAQIMTIATMAPRGEE